MASDSQQMEVIRSYCRANNLAEEETFYITKKLLEHYRNALWMTGGITGGANSILQCEGKEEVRQWYLDLERLTKVEMKSKSIDSMIFHVCRTDWVLRVIRCVMERVKEFYSWGDLYYRILDLAYFSKERMTDQEILETLDLERSTFYRRKREAILFFGVMLWEEANERKFA